MKPSAWLCAAFLLIPWLAIGQEPASDAEIPVLDDFDTIWQTIHDDFVDDTFGGVEWGKLKEEYRPKVDAAESPETAYELIAEMVGKLENRNTFVVPPWLRPPDEEEPTFDLEYAGVGILLQELESGDIFVLQVFQSTPAEAAGVLIGDLIVGVDDWRVTGEDRISQVTERVRGPVGTSVALTLQDPEGDERSVDVVRAKIDLRPDVEYKKVEGTIGYLRIPLLSSDFVEEGSRALPHLLSASGLILDIRSVNGGNLEPMVRVAQWFLGAGHMGGFESRGEAYALPFNPDAIAAYQRPLVVITDSRTYGVAEILVYLLSGYRRAQVVGDQTAGGFEVGQFVELPSGGLLHVTVGRYLSPRGEPLPQEGVTPDSEVDATDLAILRAGRDLYIEKAVEVLRNPQRR